MKTYQVELNVTGNFTPTLVSPCKIRPSPDIIFIVDPTVSFFLIPSRDSAIHYAIGEGADPALSLLSLSPAEIALIAVQVLCKGWDITVQAKLYFGLVHTLPTNAVPC